MPERLWLGFAFGAGSAIAFSLAAPFTRLGIGHGVAPLDMVIVRALAALIFIGLYLWITGSFQPVGRKARAPLVGLGVSTSLIAVGYLSSVAFIPVGLAVIIFFTFPLLILVVSPVIEKTTFGWRRFVIGMVALAGLYLAIGPNLAGLDWRGVALAFLGAFAVVGQFYCNRAVARSLSGPMVVWAAHFVVVPIALAVALFADSKLLVPGGLGAVALPGALALGVVSVSYVAGYLSQVAAFRNAPPSHVALAYNVEPVLSIALAALMFGEVLTGSQYAGGGLVLAALFLSSVMAKERDPGHAGKRGANGA
jgi:drug/metabolite transporter (DMT)-like permease